MKTELIKPSRGKWLTIMGAGLAAFFFALASVGAIERVSVAADGTEGDGPSERPGMSLNGHYVVFKSRATNLVPGGTSGEELIFLKNRMTGQVRLASSAADGTEAEDDCGNPTVTADGRHVCFNTGSENLAPNHDNSYGDVFVKDMKTGAIEWISKAPDGSTNDNGSANGFITPDGRYVVFQSRTDNLLPEDTNGEMDIFVKDRKTGALELVSNTADGTQSNDRCYNPYITPDGRYVSFRSRADNLVPDDTNGEYDIFVKDRWTGAIERVSTASGGMEGDDDCDCHHMSDNGRYVIFKSSSSNLVSDDNNETEDAFVKDRVTGVTERVSVAADGTEADGSSGGVWISTDGRFVVFKSRATNLVPEVAETESSHYQVYVKDRKAGAIAVVSTAADGTPGNDDSEAPFLTGGGYIAFKSEANNLVPDDSVGTPYPWYGTDIFMAKNPFAAYRPDTLIGASRMNQKENNRYKKGLGRGDLGLRHRLIMGGKKGHLSKFYFTAQNDGNVFDDLRVKATRSNRLVDLKYFQLGRGGGNVTAEITRRGFALGMVPHDKVVFRGEASRKKTETHKTIVIETRSSAERRKVDVGKLNIKCTH